MGTTKIQWATDTWNPVTGCTKISEGCRNCYAERMTNRFYPGRDFSEVRLHPERLDTPMRWRKPRRVFVCSMSDLFHDDVPDEVIFRVWQIMQVEAPWHTYMILTKRPERMRDYLQIWECEGTSGVADNIWLGVTAENQEMADERIPILLETPAAVRFVSVEPQLERIDITHDLDGYKNNDAYGAHLDWCIAGAESGPGARPFDMEWARDLKDQCQNAGVPYFLKQARIDGKLVKMPELGGRVWDQYPESKE